MDNVSVFLRLFLGSYTQKEFLEKREEHQLALLVLNVKDIMHRKKHEESMQKLCWPTCCELT